MIRQYPQDEGQPKTNIVEYASFAQLAPIFELPQLWQTRTLWDTWTGSRSR